SISRALLNSNKLSVSGKIPMDRRLRTLAVCVLVTCMTAMLGISAIAQEHSGQERPAQEHPGRPGTERRPVQGHPGGGAAGHQEQGGPGVLSLLPSDAVTQHSIDIAGGGKLDYTATAGTFSLFDLCGEAGRSGEPPGDLCVQWRAGRRFRVFASWSCRSAAGPVWTGRS